MITDQTVNANPCRTLVTWKSIKWKQVEETVRKLQARIVKAQKNKAFRQVKNLRRLLTRSLSARLLAVKRVSTNKGCKTPGVDGDIWTTPDQKTQAVHDLKKRIKNLPLRRIYIPKKNGRKRPISIPTMLDRAQQACHLLALDPIAETLADQHSYGFRTKRRAHDAIGYIYNILRRKGSPQWILEADIRSCFDGIDHQWLKENIPMDKSTLHKWLKSGFIEKRRLFPSRKGAPQGGVASPTLANMTLDGLEKMLFEKFGDKPGQKHRKMVHLCRYADDFIVTGNSKGLLQDLVLPAIRQFLTIRGLQIAEEKTRITHVNEGFDFLGQNTRKYKGKLLTIPSKKSITNLRKKLRQTTKKKKNGAVHLIQTMNPIVRGWCNYHQCVVSRKVFEKIDHYVFTLLWNWARKQHPNKSRRWIKKKYFLKSNGRQWVFTTRTKQGKVERQFLATSTQIRRHILIRGIANPYDEEWKSYFEKRAQQWSVPCAV